MENQFEAEVEAFHVALTEWFSGTLPRTEQGFSGLADVIAEDFTLISPRGVVDEGAPLMAQIEGAHGVQSGVQFSVRIENCRLRFADGAHCLGTYEEWQERDGVTTSRLSTVLFRVRADRRHGDVGFCRTGGYGAADAAPHVRGARRQHLGVDARRLSEPGSFGLHAGH